MAKGNFSPAACLATAGLLLGLGVATAEGQVQRAQVQVGQVQGAQVQVAEVASDHEEIGELKRLVMGLELRVDALERQNAALRNGPTVRGASGPEAAAALVRATAELTHSHSLAGDGTQASYSSPARSVLASASPVGSATAAQTAVSQAPAAAVLPAYLPGGATLNYMFDGYYEYNFNNPPGRVNDLRAYDVLSNVFSINQADVILDLEPDLAVKRRYGLRLDLQFGQATETLQGNPTNEPRPEIYRNIFQAFGTYILPVGHGLDVDVGKWASSLGVENNYTKDQMNYSRSYFFYFLPFYHSGVRTSYPIDSKLTVNYWVVNGTNQSEPTNGYKDELFGYALQPAKPLTWTFNYYLGQDHPDATAATNCTIPVQPGLCLAPITPAPNGKLHIFDSYATWQASTKLTLQGEADYFVEREWASAAPGESSAPSHVIGGAGYAEYLLSPRADLALRGEYFSDRGGLFSGTTQALKEGTATYEYKFPNGFDTFLEFRRDWSNLPYFLTSQASSPSTHQDTAGVGLVWWYGGKQGAW